MTKNKKQSAEGLNAHALQQIADLLSGAVWSPDTLDQVADVIRARGFKLADVGGVVRAERISTARNPARRASAGKCYKVTDSITSRRVWYVRATDADAAIDQISTDPPVPDIEDQTDNDPYMAEQVTRAEFERKTED